MFGKDLSQCTLNNTPELILAGKNKKCKVLQVYDGDTIWLATKINGKYYKIRVRMKGYDSPELRPKLDTLNRDEEIAAAKKAKERLENLILNKIVHVRFFKNDKYGRPLCDIYRYTKLFCIFDTIDCNSINNIMINEGYGYKYDGGTKHKYKNLKIITYT